MATLPAVPKGRELEDFVAALLQCTGFYVEKNIKEPGVLELDVVATQYADVKPQHRVFEVKSGGWGFTEVFKLLGQMTYLQVDAGALVATAPPPDKPLSLYENRCDAVNIKLLIIDKPDEAGDRFAAAGFGRADDLLREIWRFSFWIERGLIDALRQAKADSAAVAPREALNYYDLINSGVFLSRNATERVGNLYQAYQDHPYLTLGAAREEGGAAFDAVTAGTGSTPIIRKALVEGTYPVLQACMYLEHRARLAILKGAVDYLCRDREQPQPQDGIPLIDLSLVGLPSSFRQALSTMKEQPYFWLYPVFWQVFLWGWGGFLLDDHREQELEDLSRQTGLPVEAIPTALKAFDLLFPTRGGSWITRMNNAAYDYVKLVPNPFRGIGAFYRLRKSGVEHYPQLNLRGEYTGRDLNAWHNAGAALLNGSAS